MSELSENPKVTSAPQPDCPFCAKVAPGKCWMHRRADREAFDGLARMPAPDRSPDALALASSSANAAAVHSAETALRLTVDLLAVSRALVTKYGYGAKAGRSDYLVSIPADEFDTLTKAVEGFRDA